MVNGLSAAEVGGWGTAVPLDVPPAEPTAS